ncbi:MAG: YlmC/YmxH family sporulation protein [Clostridiales bacterium]|nr:YlmC/YmxH family sporulation protein [Clostridiales bacterium]MBQ3020030.1 YlmC/YmxH family sporulation protein [Clostridia bacterium]
MELSFSELRAKEVVNTQDGKKLGKVCDVALCYPENKWLGIVVPNGRGFAFKKNELFIDLKHIVKIGEDVILVNIGLPRKQSACKNERGGANIPPQCPPQNVGGGRNYEEFE